MLKLSGKCENIEVAKSIILETIETGKAFEKLVQLIKNQGGNIEYLYNTEKFEKAKYILPIILDKSGYVEKIDAEEIGKISCYLGAGRIKKEDKIDNAVGIILNKKVGDFVEKNEIIGYIHANDKEKAELGVKDVIKTYIISDDKIEKNNTIISVLS